MIPRISVVICTWNGQRWLREQLESILRQSQPVDEIILIDDCSSDDSFHIAKSILDRSRADVHIVRNDQNIGSTRSFNKAAELCTGEWIFFSDQDDIWEINKVKVFTKYFNSFPSSRWAFSDATLIDATGTVIGDSLWIRMGFSKSRQREFMQSKQIATILRRPLVTGATMAIHFNVLKFCMPFSDEWVHDHWISLVLSGSGILGIAIPEKLTQYRIHSGQQIGDKATGTASQIQHSLDTGASEYRREAEKLTRLAAHISSNGYNTDYIDSCILRNVRHFIRRAELRETSRFTRSVIACHELLCGNYAMSWSRLAFFKDLLGK